MKKLPAKFAPWIMPLMLSGIMSAIISFINIVKTLGFVDGLFTIWLQAMSYPAFGLLVDGLFTIWLQAWVLSWAIAYPAVLTAFPIVKWIMSKIIETPTPNKPT